ncbi:glycosyltransferase family 2 protein [Thermoanaerobacterium sp. CMT5567-10]|uniref:glycosyltransferase family 2 protein n=1 Tax=Thermoanaerobacterium sp. CMT5567-10 TaxID=3061989 RepID=UPI0026DFE301|nr:glycosyltransferase family 2 protein [Thermoanaerobacterium sp. CMT5567-10]WKV08528.1 glycosyltransferase family 2 protein [Thermoanaerobacterium sp. CMT5567-10]
MICILLSTYNGERHIKDQINSILKQSYTDWKLFIRDDCSSDKTTKIIKEYVNKFPEKIVLLEIGENNLGPCRSYLELVKNVTGDYIMFCDQDDVWLPDKIELTYKKMKSMEEIYKNKPILVHTDLKIVDKDLNLISHSFWKYQKLNSEIKDINKTLVQNNVTGCTIMINQKLKELLNIVPSNAIMHDWWINLIASTFGTVDYIYKSTVLYRQHGENNVGAKKYSLNFILSLAFKLKKLLKSNNKLINQGKEFYSIYGNMLEKEQKDIVYNFITLFEVGRLKRIYRIFKYKFFKYGFLRNLGFMIVMLIPSKRKGDCK